MEQTCKLNYELSTHSKEEKRKFVAGGRRKRKGSFVAKSLFSFGTQFYFLPLVFSGKEDKGRSSNSSHKRQIHSRDAARNIGRNLFAA